MRRLIFCALVALLTQFGCRKSCQHNLLPDSIRPFLFKEGSHWVFTNSATGNNDTFSVIKSESEIIHGATPIRCRGDATTETFEMTFVKGVDTFFISASGYPHLHLSNKPLTIQSNIFDSSISVGQCTVFDNRLCLTSISSLTVGSNTFNEVYEISTMIVDGNGDDKFLCNLFWVKSIGIVKAIIHDSQTTTLDLVTWNIVQ